MDKKNNTAREREREREIVCDIYYILAELAAIANRLVVIFAKVIL